MAYLLDANVFIQGKNLHYGFDFCPAFWDWIERENVAGRVFSIERVGDELKAGSDELAAWAARIGERLFLVPDQALLGALPQVSEWVATQNYSPGAANTFLQVADYYLDAELPPRPPRTHHMDMPATTRWTAEMVRALPDDGNRYEVIDGELFVTPSPALRHQDAVLAMASLVRPYVNAHGVGHVVVSPADVTFEDGSLVQPDVFVTPLFGARRPRDWSEVKALLLAVEVLSPSTARADRRVKLRLYQRQHVPEYWIVDVDARLIERWRLGDQRPEIVADRLEWLPDPANPPLIIDLPAYFRDVTGD